MWHIVNDTNKIILDIFKKEISDKIFYMLLDISERIELNFLTLNSGDHDKWKESIIYKKSAKKNLFDYIFNHKTFEELFNSIVIKYTRLQILEYYRIYKEQNRNVNLLNYNVEVSICNEFKYLFVDLFYTDFFNDDTIWHTLIEDTYNRKKFHNNFKQDNHNLFLCPYCDIDSTISKANNEIEHFLPKSKFPFLSMNALNLTSSCQSCNSAEEGKGQNVIKPIVSPYNTQIGDLIKFSIDEPNKNIVLNNTYKDDSVTNYIKLLQLNKRYSEERVYIIVTNKIQSILEEMPYSKSTREDYLLYMEKYHNNGCKSEQLTFAIKSILTS